MKCKISSITIVALLLSCLTLSTGCFSSDMALVNIHIQGGTTASATQPVKAKSFIDRFLMFFSTPVYAWEYTPNTLLIQITGQEDKIFESFPLDTNTFSYEVPAGIPVTITVITENNDSEKNWGAQTTVNLKQGQEADITLKMVPIVRIFNVGYDGYNIRINFDVAYSFEYGRFYATGYRLYRSDTQFGTYRAVSPPPQTICNEDCVATDTEANIYRSYFYKVSVISENGEGLLSDPVEYFPIF